MRNVTKISVNNKLLENIDYINQERPIEFYKVNLKFHNTDQIPWHWHPVFQLAKVKEGSAHYYVGEEDFLLEEGDGILINVNQLHRYDPVEVFPESKAASDKTTGDLWRSVSVRMINIMFLPEFIAATYTLAYKKYVEPILIEGDYPCFVLRKNVVWQKEILDLFEDAFLLEENRSELCYEMKVHEYMSKMWRGLWKNKDWFSKKHVSKGKVISQVRMKQMMMFINENYKEKLTLEEIAAAACISEREALRCFKENMRKTPFHYLLEFRVNQAKNLLVSGDEAVVEIALACGFESASYFNRVFRRCVGMTPSEFRRRMWQSEQEENK